MKQSAQVVMPENSVHLWMRFISKAVLLFYWSSSSFCISVFLNWEKYIKANILAWIACRMKIGYFFSYRVVIHFVYCFSLSIVKVWKCYLLKSSEDIKIAGKRKQKYPLRYRGNCALVKYSRINMQFICQSKRHAGTLAHLFSLSPLYRSFFSLELRKS